MKIILFFAVYLLLSCGNNNTNTGHASEAHEPAQRNETQIRQVRPAFTSLQPPVGAHIAELFDHYIHVKTALVNANAAEARRGAEAMVKIVRGFDKSLFPADQKQAYDRNISGIRNAAASIAGSDDLQAQRGHFATLSQHAYELARSFGAGRPLYHEHCPMAFNDRGAMWLSESSEIRNPYFGDEMLKCGTVEEVIQN